MTFLRNLAIKANCFGDKIGLWESVDLNQNGVLTIYGGHMQIIFRACRGCVWLLGLRIHQKNRRRLKMALIELGRIEDPPPEAEDQSKPQKP